MRVSEFTLTPFLASLWINIMVMDRLYHICGRRCLSFCRESLPGRRQVSSCASFFDNLTRLGIFRIPGSPEEANWYKKLFNEGREVNFKCSCHDVVGLLKMYIRSLPDPIIPHFFNAQIPFLVGMWDVLAPAHFFQNNILEIRIIQDSSTKLNS